MNRLSFVLLIGAPLMASGGCGDDSQTSTDGSGGCSGICGGTGGSGGLGGMGGAPFIPTATDVQFAAQNPIPTGEWIVFNDWVPQPNEVLVMAPDGTQELTVFEAFRVWSMGVSNDATKIAFSAGDPEQAEHFGIMIGDAIQPTFLYDVGTESAVNLTYGNINDECHRFGPGDAYLYLCRRYDFADGVQAKGYRVGRVDLSTKELEWLTPEDPTSLTLNPEPTSDETELYYTRVPIPGNRSIVRAPLPSGTEVGVKALAGNPVLSPDGTLMLSNDYQQMGALVVTDLDGAGSITLATPGTDESLSTARWSPNGTQIVYLRWVDADVCAHVEIVDADGSDVASPLRIHDCATSGRSITELAWITR